jgi:hypothetical protein
MRKARVDEIEARERILAEGLAALAGDLVLVDAADYVVFLRTGRFTNVASLVKSSAELWFRPGTVRFGQSGDVEVDWALLPRIALDMEFHNQGVHVYFRLLLGKVDKVVDITYIVFDRARSNAGENTEQLSAAFADARLGSETTTPMLLR